MPRGGLLRATGWADALGAQIATLRASGPKRKVLVTSAPYTAPPCDVSVRIGPA